MPIRGPALPLGIAAGIVVLVVAGMISITVGAADIDVLVVRDSLLRYDTSDLAHLIVRTVRLPRVLAGVLVGCGLGASGAIMQGVTRNPLASPGLLGINAGASLALVLGISVLGSPSLSVYALLALTGAGAAAAVVYGLASFGRGGVTPVRLTLAGVIFSSFTAACVTSILTLDEGTFDRIRYWTVGSLTGRDSEVVSAMTPMVLAGLAIALVLASHITTLSLGEGIASGLGQQTGRVKAVSALAVVLLAGGAVGIAGPVGFVGFVVPHVARWFVGADYRWVIPYSAVLGAILVTISDAAGRVVLSPLEIPVGVMCALVGGPFFVYTIRTKTL